MVKVNLFLYYCIVLYFIVFCSCLYSHDTGPTDETDDYIISGNMPKGCILNCKTDKLENINTILKSSLDLMQNGSHDK